MEYINFAFIENTVVLQNKSCKSDSGPWACRIIYQINGKCCIIWQQGNMEARDELWDC